ncbi:MAG: hypothetical protein KME17_12430 [Cyanosarcina radialis HA8281-LM2]|jgi:hypothetical protein|nr:hypothetical protein [Cyanosarcina radialis HA8281-LM2]
MNQTKFPDRWDEERVKAVILHYDEQTEDEAVEEDDMTLADGTQSVIEIPKELVPAVRELIARYQQAHA